MPFYYKMAKVTSLDKAELLQSQTAFIYLYFNEYYCPPSACSLKQTL